MNLSGGEKPQEETGFLERNPVSSDFIYSGSQLNELQISAPWPPGYNP
jgi:hypothetical protein